MSSRLTWEPYYQEPTPDKNASGNILYDYAVRPPRPAILFALDPETGRHVAITSRGWLISQGKHRFPWNDIQRPLPDPVPSEDPASPLGWFRAFLRLDAARYDEAWQALIDWMLHALQPVDKPGFEHYPILLLTGPPDSGKSVAAKLLTQLLDATREPIHSPSYLARRFPELAVKHHVLAFDEIGKVLRVPTGMSLRPVIVTSRERSPALVPADRIVTIELPLVEKPISQEEIWQTFAEQRPAILGAILTLLVGTV
jgi:hypothetical protein